MPDIAHLPASFFLNGQIGYKFGKSGYLILNSIYYKYTLEDKYFNNIEIILSDIIEHIEENKIAIREFEELADFSRVMFFLDNIGILELEDYKPLLKTITRKIDHYFLENLAQNDFHFCRGILVFGNFYLEVPKKINSFSKELRLIVDWTERNSFLQNDGYYWLNANPNFKGKIYLSSVLGNLSVCKFLLEASRLDIEKADTILHKGMHFVLQQMSWNETGLGIFVDPIDKIEESGTKPMLQWVEGSFNILFSLVVDFKNYLKEDEYDFIFNNLLIVADMKEDEVECPKNSIGYGSIGISLMFEKLHRIAKHDKFKQAALYWYGLAIKRMKQREKEFEKFPDTVRFTGFIPGYTGIQTALKLFEEKETHIIDKLIYI